MCLIRSIWQTLCFAVSRSAHNAEASLPNAVPIASPPGGRHTCSGEEVQALMQHDYTRVAVVWLAAPWGCLPCGQALRVMCSTGCVGCQAYLHWMLGWPCLCLESFTQWCEAVKGCKQLLSSSSHKQGVCGCLASALLVTISVSAQAAAWSGASSWSDCGSASGVQRWVALLFVFA
jgi:hypothetical protein